MSEITKKQAEDFIIEYISQNPEEAAGLLTSMMISITESLIKIDDSYIEGIEEKEIEITGNYRNVTIHPPN